MTVFIGYTVITVNPTVGVVFYESQENEVHRERSGKLESHGK